MIREMRHGRQLLREEESIRILHKMQSGVLALADPKGYPYAVPLHYLYEKGKLYFHSPQEGYKIELLKVNNKVSFCVVEQDVIVPEEFTSHYRSVVLFGTTRILTEQKAIRHFLEAFALKYAPKEIEDIHMEMTLGWNHLYMIEMTIEQMTGREAIELVRERETGNTSSLTKEFGA